MEDEEEAEMGRADKANNMAARTKAVEASHMLLNDVARDCSEDGGGGGSCDGEG